ncbi:polymorphic toxin type 46 domain-containing protein [Pseudomonas sp. KCJK8751]|uniref:polymorphic toxin type 46 domain-containing protein n=1 Tax=Pseudomonas sp. KCJK8751 TaxID=3344564 RepID=UPI0039059EC0
MNRKRNRGKTLWQFQVPGGRQSMWYSPTWPSAPGCSCSGSMMTGCASSRITTFKLVSPGD